MDILALDRLVASLPARQTVKKRTEASDAATEAVVNAKVAHTAQSAPALGTAAAVVKSAQAEDGVQLTADALKLSSQTLAKHTLAAPALSAGGEILTGLNKAAQGDTFGAATAARTAAEKIAPALANSAAGAVISAVILSTGDDKFSEQTDVMKRSAQRMMSSRMSNVQRAKAGLDLTVAAQNAAVLGRTMGNAGVTVGRYGVKLMSHSPSLAPVVSSMRTTAGVVVKSPVGRVCSFLNKWIPLLNVAGVALSAKTAIDVFRTREASTTSRSLAVASLASAGVALWAGFKLPGLPFLGVAAASIALDLSLGGARARDAKTGDMDAQAGAWLAHPTDAVASLGSWIGKTVPALGRSAVAAWS